MFSFAVKGEVVQFVFVLLAIVIAAAVEELLPDFLGQGFPMLLAFVMVMSSRLSVLAGVMTAVGAGSFETALSSLPPMTAICFFVIASLLSRREYFPRPFLIAIFPLFEFWTALCAVGSMGDVFARMLVSVPLGAIAMGIMSMTVAWTAGKAGVDG